MVTINVNDKGDCHVYVRGDWDKVQQHLLVAATKVRTMAADTRKFARAASGTTPLADLRKKPETTPEPIPAWPLEQKPTTPDDKWRFGRNDRPAGGAA